MEEKTCTVDIPVSDSEGMYLRLTSDDGEKVMYYITRKAAEKLVEDIKNNLR